MKLSKAPKIKRNLPCPCGSGIKYKKCCLRKERKQFEEQLKIKRMMKELEKSESKEEGCDGRS